MDGSAFHGPLATVYAERAGGRGLDALLLSPDDALPVPTAAAWAGAADPVTVADLLVRAEADLASPWPVPLASAAARVNRDGDRESWERVAFARQRRLSRATVAAAATLEERWIDEVADGVVLLCEQSSWCWPAHDDAFWKHGAVLPAVDDPYLDLGAGEVVAQLAWIDQLLGAVLDERYPGLRARIRLEARRRVIDPFLARRDWHWLGLDGDVHNWNPWIHGNVLVAALRLLDSPGDTADRERTVALAIEGLDRYIASLPPDGAIDEGYAYWWNGACRALEALDLLAYATGGVLDAVPSIESLRQTVAFPHRMHLGGHWYLNLADGQARPGSDHPWHALHAAARRVDDAEAQAHAASHRHPGRPAATEATGLGRLLRGAVDADWLAAAPGASPLPRTVWFGSTQVLLAREQAGSARGLTLAAKGGHNGEHHNHNDVGSVVIASDGVPVVVDAGRPTYTRATFGPERYSIWTMQSSWHSVPEVRGAAQGVGTEFAAAMVAERETGASASLSMDLAAAYPVEGLKRWRRDVRLDRAPEPRVVIEDAWSLEPWTGDDEPPTTVHLLIAGDIELGTGQARVTPLEGATPVVLRWDDDAPARVTVRALDDPMLSSVWGARLSRLELLVTHRDRIIVTVQLTQRIGEDIP